MPAISTFSAPPGRSAWYFSIAARSSAASPPTLTIRPPWTSRPRLLGPTEETNAATGRVSSHLPQRIASRAASACSRGVPSLVPATITRSISLHSRWTSGSASSSSV